METKTVEEFFWECPHCRFRASTQEVKQSQFAWEHCPRCGVSFYKFHKKAWKQTVFEGEEK